MDRHVFTSPETELTDKFEGEIIQKSFQAVIDELIARFGGAKDEMKISFGSYKQSFHVMENVDNITCQNTVTLSFVSAGSEWKGFSMERKGSCSDGTLEETHESGLEYIGFNQLDSIHPLGDFLTILECFHPTETIYNAIELDFELMRENLLERKSA